MFADMPSDRPPLTQARLKELLHYDPETGIFTWLVTRGGGASSGRKAGAINRRTGYFRIGLDGKDYLSHRLAWLYSYGSWPTDQLDHIDRDRSNNRISNLRPSNGAGNSNNRGLRSDNTSGFRGVRAVKNKKHVRWASYGCVDGKDKYLGRFSTPEEAASVAEAWRKEHHGEFYSCIPNPETLSPNPES